MEFDLDIALEFVEKISPEPAPIGGGGSAATGDLMLPIILATLMVLLFSACAFAFFKKRKTFAKHSTKSSLIAKSIPRIASNKIAIAIIAVAVAFLAIFGIATVQAKAAGNESIETPSNVKAYIDKEAGTVEFDSSYLKNICDRELVVEWSNVTQPEESASIADLKNSNFKILGMGGTIFEGGPDPDGQYVPQDLSALKAGETSNMNFALTNVSTDDLLKLIGQKVFVIKLRFLDSAVPVPQANDLTYNAQTQTGVNSGIGYTLSGTTEAKDAGTYTATASLISGFVWADGTYEDKQISWTIDPFALTITSANGEKTYDGAKAEKQEATESPKFFDGEGVDYSWNSNVVNVDQTADENNTFTYTAKEGTNLSNYEITLKYGKLTVLPRPITVKSQDKSWDYDASPHTCENVDVAQGEWVEGDGLKYFNFASIIDYSDTATPNTYEYIADGKTNLNNYTITAKYGSLQINKIETAIIVTANSNEKMYDGTALTDDGFTFTPNVLKTPDTLTAEITGEKTDVGTANNVVGKVKVMRGNVDATQNYTFGTHINGELKITTRPITLTSATNSWTYDGQAHYDTTITVGGEGWAGTDYATYSNFTTVTDYSDQPVKNTFTYTEGTGTKFSNYDFTIINGDLSISKITTQIIVTAGSDTKPYDGTDLTCDTFTYTEGVLVTGDRIDATTLGSIKNVGTAKNEVTEVKVFRGEDDITANYTFGTHVDGALEVIPRAVTISSKEGKLEYNAQAQSYEEVEVVEGSFVTGEGLVYSRFATATDYSAEGIDNTFSYAAQEGTTLTNYNITVQYNKLYITKVATPIVVTAASDEKTYDGDALTNSEFTFTSGVLKGNDKLQATIEGSITNVGTANNNVTAVKIMRDTTDATTNYTFGSHVAGALEITQRDITLLSEGQTWAYDGKAHTWEKANVAEGTSWVDGEGVDYINFPSITYCNGEGQENTFDVMAHEGTNLNNYNITKKFGTIKITQSATAIVVTANSKTKTYDGTELKEPGYTYDASLLAEGDTLQATVEGSVKDVGTAENKVMSVTVMRGTKDVTENYTFGTHIKGTLTVEKRTVVLESEGYEWIYDSRLHGNQVAKVADGYSFPSGEGVTYKNFTTLTDCTTVDNEFEYEAQAGTNLKQNYEITCEYGKLTINPITTELKVTASSKSKTYDRTELSDNTFTYTENVLQGEDRLDVTFDTSSTITNAGSVVNKIAGIKVKRGNNDITGNYSNITSEDGVLTVNPRSIILTSGTKSWTFDTETHSCEEVTVSGDGLVDGEGFKYSKFATVSTVGEGQVENTFTYEPNEKTLLANYSITVVNGTIQIATEKTPIVVTANSNTKVYDGEELTDAGFTFTEGVIPENYELRAKVEGSQTNAGESENKVTSIQIFNDAGVDVTDNFTIGTPVAGKLTVTKRVITLVSESNSCTYDGKEHSWTTVTPKAGTSWVEGEGVTYKNHTTITDHQNQAIDNDFGYEANEGTNLDNYSITKELGKIQIDKIETAIIIMPASDTKAYDGSSLTNSNFTLKQGSLVDGDVLEVEMDGSVTDVGSVNNAVDTYKVMRGEVVATGNYNFDAPEIGTLTITARSVTLTSGSDSWEYDAAEHDCTTVNADGFVSGEGAIYSGFPTIKDYVEGGKSNTFTYTLNSNTKSTNYSITVVPGTIAINKVAAALVVTANSNSKTYDGTALKDSGFTHNNVLKGTDESVTAVISGGQTNAGSSANTVGTVNVLRGNVDITSNYTLGSHVDGTLTVNKRAVTLTSATASQEYSGQAFTAESVTADGFVEGEGATYSNFKQVIDVCTDVENTFDYTLKANTLADNYTIKKVPGKLSITQVATAIVLKAGSAEKKYDGTKLESNTYTVTAGAVKGNDQLVVTITGEITNAGSDANKVTAVKVMRGEVDATTNYTFGTHADGTLTVNKRNVILTSGDATAEYSALALQNTNVTVSGDGFISGEGASYSNFAAPIDVCTNTANTFTYTFNEGTLADNYNITQVTGKLTITKVATAIVLKADSETKLYNGTKLEKHSYTFSSGAVKGNDTIEVTYSGEITNAGTADNTITSVTIKRGNDDATANYTFGTHEKGKLTVNKRSVTLTSATASKVYDSTPLTNSGVTVSGDDWASGEGATYNVTGTVTDVSEGTVDNAFTYTLNNGTLAGNYTITKVEGKLSITKITTPIVVTANSSSKTYDGTALTDSGFSYTKNVIQTNDTLSATVVGEQTNAGTSENIVTSVTIKRGNDDATSNYTFGTHVSGTLTVNKRIVELSWSSSDLGKYNGSNHIGDISASITNKVQGDTVTPSIQVKDSSQVVTSIVDAGTYYATVTSLGGNDAANYAIPSEITPQEFVLSKADSTMTFTPGSVTSTYSTLATSKTFTAATGAYGTITYAITGGDKTGFSLSSASSTTINAVAKQGAKTSYSIKITATDSGDKNHEAKDIEATLTWTIEKATPTVSWSGVKSDEYKLDRNVPVASYNFVFAEKGISISTTNTDTGVSFSVTGTDLPDGVSIADNAKIVIDPEVNSNTTFELTVNAKSNESANYYASSSVSSTIKIAISSLWYKISSGTLYLSAFKTDKATIEAANVLDVTKLSEIPWQDSAATRKSITSCLIQGDSSSPKIKPTSMKQWFYGLATCTGYTGLDNIDTSNVQNFSGLFYTNIKVESFNLYNFSVAQTSNTGNMFYRCTGTTEITIGTNWKKNLSDCALPGDGWLDSVGHGYALADIPVGVNATYTKGTKTLSVVAPDSSIAQFTLPDGSAFPSVIYFNNTFSLNLKTYKTETTGYDAQTHQYISKYEQYINIDVVSSGSVTYNYHGVLNFTQNGYGLNSWDVANATPEEETEEYTSYFITSTDTLTVNYSSAMAATAVQYSNGEMVFYYDNNDHSLDQNYLNQYSVDNTQVTMELLEENSPSARIPKWISSSYYPYNNVTSIRFDASFKNLHSLQFYVQEKDQGYVNYGIPFLSMSGWFMNFSNVSSVTGLENVPSGIYDMRNMFYGFKNSSEMETLDLSSLDMRSVVFADYMFGNFGLLNCNIILPDNVSNNVVEDDFKKYDTNSIIYCYMFNGSSALNNVTFGQSFGNTELPCNLMCMFNNCIQLKSAELTTINNLGQKECNVDHMFNGCIGLSSMLIDTHIPHNEISMSYLGILDANWLDANGQHYSIKDPMENNLLYSAKGLINIHFGNYVAASSGGGFNEPGNYSLDLNVVPGVHMEFDSREMKFYLSHENVKSEEPMCEIQLYLNSPYEFDHVEGIPEKTISHDTNITVYYNLGGQILKTAKLVKTSVGKYGSNYTFYYDALTETDYKNKFGDDFQDFWYVKNTFDTDKPEWYDEKGYNTISGNVEFDKSFKEFHSYYEGSNLVNFEGMANWFKGATINSLNGTENIPTGVTDIQYLFYSSYLYMSDKCLDLSKADFSCVWYAYGAFANIKRASDVNSIIIPDNFASVNKGQYSGYADINNIFSDPEAGLNMWIENITIGNNFGANSNNFMYLFAGLEYLNTVKIGSNFAACKDTKDPINLTYMFAACNYLMKVDISGLCEGLEYDMSYMCYGNARLMSLELPKYQIYLSAAYQAFYQCVLIKSLDFTNFVFLNGVYNYQDMLWETYTLGTLSIGSSWIKNASFYDVGLDSTRWFGDKLSWYRGDVAWDDYDAPIITNSIYYEHMAVNITISIPEEYRDVARFTYGGRISNLYEISYNVFDSYGYWYQTGDKGIAILWGASEEYVELVCDDSVFLNEWISNYESGEPITYEKGPAYVTPSLQPMQETPKAVYDKLSGDVTLYYDDIDHSGDNIRVWNITEEAFISVKEVNSIIIDSSFKDATQYYDPEQSQLKPLTKAHEWFSGIGIRSVKGIENMPPNIVNVSSMFSGAYFFDENYVLDLRNWDMTNISVADNMFDQAGRDGYRNLSVFLPDNFGSNASTTTMVSMFSQCGFNHIQFGNNFAPHGTTMEKMFWGATYLQELDMSTFTSTRDDIILYYLCVGCSSLTSVKLWGVSVTPSTIEAAFAGCSALTDLDMHNINISSLSIAQDMLSSCKSLSKLKFGELPSDTTISLLGYQTPWVNYGTWTAEGVETPNFASYPLSSNVLYENIDYATVKFTSTHNVDITYNDEVVMHEYTFKVLKGSEISSTTSSDISIRYDGNKVFSLHVPDSTYEIRFMSWESEGSIDDTHILGDGTFTASYDDGKTAKAVMYGDGGTRAQATDFVFYFDRKEYIVDGRNILAVYNVKNTSDVEEIFPEWHAPGHDLDYLPKRIVIDESFKDFTEYRDQGKNRVTFDSIDWWFKDMENAEFVGLENFAPNQLKSAVYAFCSTGSNPDRPDVNPYIETLDLRGFQQNNLENMRWMFSGSFYKNILVNDSFGKSATNIYGLFSYCLYLESIDLRSFDTSKITNFENALQNLERLERFIVGDSWNLTMNECGLPEPEQYPWVDSFGNVYNIKAVPQPNVLYKQLMMSQLSTNDSDGQLSNSNNNIAEDDEIIDPEINNVPMIDEQTGADDAAALVGAGVPLALGLTFAKRRIRGKHVKIK